MLLPGASTHWLTAHVALVLEEVEGAESICSSAARYLASALEGRGACGYNGRVGWDCDSTAQALMAVHRFGLPLPASSLDLLLAAQRRDGGFPTYSSALDMAPTGWHSSHADVTAIVLMAMRRLSAPPASLERAEAWLRAHGPQGLLISYWWPHPAYGLWTQARSGFEAGAAARSAVALLGEGTGEPWLAMLLAAAAGERSPSIEASKARLLRGQRVDGSWPCAPCLRVTDPRCDVATQSNPGRSYADRRRIFSTAHAVAALARLERRAAALEG
jgi:hypothetical protein